MRDQRRSLQVPQLLGDTEDFNSPARLLQELGIPLHPPQVRGGGGSLIACKLVQALLAPGGNEACTCFSWSELVHDCIQYLHHQLVPLLRPGRAGA